MTGIARYLVSLPERVLRSAAALAGGLVRELGDVSLPAAVRRTKTYQMMVGIALRFMIEQVGILAFRASPVWIMAALADVSGGGRQIVQEIAEALKEERLLEGDKFENVDQILNGLEQTAGRA